MSWQDDPVVENVSAAVPSRGGWQDDPVVERSASPAADSVPKHDVDLLTRAGMAANRTAASILTAPQDAIRWGVRGIAKTVGLGDPSPVSAEERYKTTLADFGRSVGVEGAHPDSATPATTLPQKIAEGVGSGAAEAMMTGGAGGLFVNTLKASASFGNTLAKIIAGTGATSNAVLGATSGAGAAIAEDMAPEALKPTAAMLGGIAGGTVGAAAETGLRAVPGLVGSAVRSNFENPNVAAARKIMETAEPRKLGDPDVPGLREQVDDYVETGPTVPGSEPTMFQLTGDKKLGELERDVRTANPGAYTDVLERQGVARTDAVNNAVDPAADPNAVGAFVRQRLDNIEAEYGSAVAKARQEAETRAAATGGTQFGAQAEADYGGGLQKQLDTLDRQRKAAEDRLWENFREAAGDKPIAIRDFKKAVAEIEGGIGPMAKRPKGEEADILGTIRAAGDFATFRDIGDLRSQITDALRNPQELTGTQRRRLSDVLGRLDDTLDTEVALVAEDPVARAALIKRVQEQRGLQEHAELQAKAYNESLPTGTAPVDFLPESHEAETAARIIRGWSPETRVDRPQSLFDFVRRNGGIRMGTPEAGDIRSADLGRLPGLLQLQGVQADRLAQNAADAGFRFGKETKYGSGVDTDGFITALIEDAGGRRKHFPDTPETAQWEAQQQYLEQFGNYLSDIGLNPKGMAARDVAWVLRQQPEEARFLALLARRDALGETGSIEVARRLDDEIATARTGLAPKAGEWNTSGLRDLPAPTREELDSYYGEYQRTSGAYRTSEPIAGEPGFAPGGSPASGQVEGFGPGGARPAQEAPGVRAAGLTADDVALYGQARAATRERKETFGSGAVGDVLKPGRGGTFGLTQSSVPSKLLGKPENLRNFVNAAGDSPEAMGLAQDALAFDMRRAAVKDGLISPQKLADWTAKNAEALRQFPEMAVKFADAGKATAALDTAIANQKAAVETFQTKAVSKFLDDKNPRAALEQAMNTPEAFKSLVAEVKQDPSAFAGLKRLAVELILSKGGVVAEDGTLAGAKEAGTSGTPQLAANKVQNFFINRRGMLADIFDEGELKNIADVTADMQRAARTVKIPDQSNTPQDLKGGVLREYLGAALGKVGGLAGGAAPGLYMGEPITAAIGAAIGGGAQLWRQVYQGRVDRAVADMMLNPKVFAEWAPRVKEVEPGRHLEQFGRRMRALLGQEVIQAIDREDQRSP